MRIVFAAVCLAALAISHGSAAESTDAPGFPGRWLRIDVDLDEASRTRGISDATSKLSWVMRSMARPILRRSTVPPEEYIFSRSRDGLQMAPRGREPRPLSLDGVERQFEHDSRTITVSSHQLGDAIEQRWRTQQGYGSNTFRVTDEGRTLLVDSVIQVTAISGVSPIRYQAHFVRRGGVSTVAHPVP